jgi:hypothetical protein
MPVMAASWLAPASTLAVSDPRTPPKHNPSQGRFGGGSKNHELSGRKAGTGLVVVGVPGGE